MSKPTSLSFPRQALAVLRGMRPHQWVKNLLLFVPIGMAHQFQDLDKLGDTLFGFLAFSAVASAIYLINDVVDRESDRRHPNKKNRPVASGELGATPALIVAVSLVAGGAGLAFLMIENAWFTAILGIYLLATSSYSFWLKRIALLDVFVLASLYSLRLLAGGVASGVEVSNWLLAFSSFLFSSLAFVKRYAELDRVDLEGQEAAAGRGYSVGDLSLIENMGVVAGYLSVLILALYVNDDAILYQRPRILWMLCPLLMYWISRVWMLAKRRRLSEDPVVFASTDPISWLIGAAAVGLLFAAT